MCVYFGRTLGSPPGLPGGGITGMLPTSGVGALIPGSTFGGHRTPSLWASLSLRFVPLPVVAFGGCGDCGVGVSGILNGIPRRARRPSSRVATLRWAEPAPLRQPASKSPLRSPDRNSCAPPFGNLRETSGNPIRFPKRVNAASVLAEADQREMAERWHRSAFDQPHAVALRPLREPLPGKLRAPS